MNTLEKKIKTECRRFKEVTGAGEKKDTQAVVDFYAYADDPLGLIGLLWPDANLYDKQQEIVMSVRDNDETIVVAGNMLGKDYAAGVTALVAFLSHPVARIVCTSVRADHLRVLFGEIGRFINTSSYPEDRQRFGVLNQVNGGPLIVNHWDIRKVNVAGQVCPISYLRGMVSEKGEGMAGHHAPYTLFIGDEGSGIDDVTYTQAATWAKRILVIGNPNQTTNFFYRSIKGGDVFIED